MPKRLPSFLRNHQRRPAEPRVSGEELWWPTSHSGPGGTVVTEDSALRLPALLSAHTTLATDVAVLPLRVYKTDPDGGRQIASTHPVDRIWTRSPDGKRTPIRWVQALMGHVLGRGNGFAEIQRLGNGKPFKLHLLSPKTTEPVEAGDDVYYRLGNGRTVPGEDVLHLAGFGYDGLSGYNFTKLLNDSIALGLASQGHAVDYFENGAEPGGWIETPHKLTDEARKTFREEWDLKHRGRGNRHRPGLLHQGAKWNQTTTDPEKSQLLETRRFQVLEAIRALRVPPHKAGDFSQAHLANLEESNLDYLMTALMGWLEAFEQECNLKLFSESEWAQGYYVEFNVNALLRGNIISRFAAYGKALADGWMNRDDVRRRENMNPIGEAKGGGKYLVPLNLTTLEVAGQPQSAGSAQPTDAAPADVSSPALDPSGPPEDDSPAARRVGMWLDGDQMFSLKRLLNDIALGELPADAGWAMIAASFPGLPDAEIDAMINPLLTYTPKSARAAS